MAWALDMGPVGVVAAGAAKIQIKLQAAGPNEAGDGASLLRGGGSSSLFERRRAALGEALRLREPRSSG